MTCLTLDTKTLRAATKDLHLPSTLHLHKEEVMLLVPVQTKLAFGTESQMWVPLLELDARPQSYACLRVEKQTTITDSFLGGMLNAPKWLY